jgi:hypothetical protein
MSPATRACFAHCVECGLPSADEERSTVTTFEKFATAILCLALVDLVLAQELFELRSPTVALSRNRQPSGGNHDANCF